ncbi:MAG: hypothetical protein NDP13_01015 [Crenarchaeota archaeon]|nr:hypothetical protein [Thermoproteota archaeon]
MSSSSLLDVLKIIEDRELKIQERLAAINKIPQLDSNILIANIRRILETLTYLGKYVEMGIPSEQETYGTLLLILSEVLKLAPKYIDETFKFLRKIHEAFPKTLSERALTMTLHALKNFVGIKHEIIFDPYVKDLFRKALMSKEHYVRLEGLRSLIDSLWIVPWATSYYMDLLNLLISNEQDPLHATLFEELGKIAKKSYLPVRPIVQMLLKEYTIPTNIPKHVVRFIANLNIPIYKREDINSVGKLLEEIALLHKDSELGIISIFGLANMYRNPALIEEKQRLIKLLEQLSTEATKSANINLALACLKALSIPAWGDLEIPESIIEGLLSAYSKIQDPHQCHLFIDALFSVYSNLPRLSRLIIGFLVNELTRITDIELMRKFTDTLSAIASSAPQENIIKDILKFTLAAYNRSDEEFSAFMRIWVAENVLLRIARTNPRIILDSADELLDAYRKVPSATLYEIFCRIFFEALKLHPNHENAVKLLDYILDAPNYEETYDTILRIISELAHKFKEHLTEKLDKFSAILDVILRKQREITDVREKYYLIDNAMKNLARILNTINPAVKPEVLPDYCDILLLMLINASEDVLKDVEFLLKNFITESNKRSFLSEKAREKAIPPRGLEVLKRIGVL